MSAESAAITRADPDQRLAQEAADLDHVAMAKRFEAEGGLEILSQRDVDHRLGDVAATFGGDLAHAAADQIGIHAAGPLHESVGEVQL